MDSDTPDDIADGIAEAGRQFEMARHMARTEHRRVVLNVRFLPNGGVKCEMLVTPGTRHTAGGAVPRHRARPNG